MSFLLACIICLSVLFQSLSTKAAVGTVTSSNEIAWGLETGSFTVNGIHAFCCQYVKSRPPAGTAIKEFKPCADEVMRKILYYGYKGPKNVLGTDAKAHVLTAIALSDAHIGESQTGVKAKYDEFYWDVVNNPSKYPSPPKNFKTYFAITPYDTMQNLVFYEMEQNGYANIIKTSANTNITSGNACYSLYGAKYGVYSEADLSEQAKVCILTTNEEGVTEVKELPPGTYYAKELEAPKGFALNAEIITFVVSEKQTTTIRVSDEPQTNPIPLLLEKIDSETNDNIAQGKASLKGARFVVKYYNGLWEKDVNPELNGKKPTKEWKVETDEHGRAYLNEDVPLGTLTIQEIQPSEGYLLNPTVFIRQITSEGSAKTVSTYQSPIVEEKPIKVVVYKVQNGNHIPIPGTVFEVKFPDGSTKEYVTDESGKIQFAGLSFGSYEIREIEAEEGYVLNETGCTFVVDERTKQDIEITIDNTPAPYEVVVEKKDTYENGLEGAEFVLYLDEACTKEVMRGITDETGCLRFESLQVKTNYFLKETKVPAGYEAEVGEEGEPKVYKIYAESVPVKDEFHVWINDELTDHVQGDKNKKQVHLTIINTPNIVLPKTGSSERLFITLTGLMLCGISIYQTKKRRKHI